MQMYIVLVLLFQIHCVYSQNNNISNYEKRAFICGKTLAITVHNKGDDQRPFSFCQLFIVGRKELAELASNVVRKNGVPLTVVSFELMMETLGRCQNYTDGTSRWRGKLERQLEVALPTKTPISFVPSGFKWCGPGRTAEHFFDLGEKQDGDLCCRVHDHCPMSLDSNKLEYGIENKSPFTITRCECDHQLAQCLIKADAKIIVDIYVFTVKNTCLKATEDQRVLAYGEITHITD